MILHILMISSKNIRIINGGVLPLCHIEVSNTRGEIDKNRYSLNIGLIICGLYEAIAIRKV